MKKHILVLTILISLSLLNSISAFAQTPEEYVHLGNVNSRQEKYKEAVVDYTKAIAARANYTNAYYNRGYAYAELRKYKKAMDDLYKALDLDPQYAPAYHVLGIIYFFKKKYALAIAAYSKAIDLDPNNVSFYFSRLSAYFKMGNKEKAWKDVIKIQHLGGTVDPAIINILKNKKYRE